MRQSIRDGQNITVSAEELTFKQQPPALLHQVNPTQNQYYTVLNTTKNVLLEAITVAVFTTSESVMVRLTTEAGIFYNNPVSVSADTAMYFYVSPTSSELKVKATAVDLTSFINMECRSLKVEVKKTTAAGTGDLRACVMYAKRI